MLRVTGDGQRLLLREHRGRPRRRRRQQAARVHVGAELRLLVGDAEEGRFLVVLADLSFSNNPEIPMRNEIQRIFITDNCYLRHLHRSKGKEKTREPRGRTVFNRNIQSQVENETNNVNINDSDKDDNFYAVS